MCGVAGFLEFRPHAFSDSLAQSMINRLQHRGPDGEGLFQSGPITLAHRRLAILDLSQLAHQPFVDRTTGSALSYNGEIYNYTELRQELIKCGLVFQSSGDTEVLFRGLEFYGIDFLKQLEGDFALAFWNGRQRALYLARDRFGVKPLYVRRLAHGILFASEIKALLEGGTKKDVSSEAIEHLMARRYAPAPLSPFKDIHKVEPATFQRWLPDGSSTVNTYWRLSTRVATDLEDSFSQSVKGRLQSDVPVGCFLSGGIDSSAIADQAFEHSGMNLHSFTYRIPDGSQDAEQAREFAERLGFVHEEIQHPVNWNQDIKQILFHLEEPLGDSTLLPTFRLCESASKSVKVALSGEGADELFGGYAHQKLLFLTDSLRRHMPSLAIEGLKSLLVRLPLGALKSPLYPVAIESEMVDRFGNLLSSPPDLMHDHLLISSLFSAGEREFLLAHSLGDDPLIEETRGRLRKVEVQSQWQGLLALDLQGWLSDYGLHRLDRLGMAHGLEVRVPFVNHHLAESVFSSPAALFSWRNRKPLLRSYAQTRPRLKGFAHRSKHPLFFPIERLKTDDVLHWSRDILSPARVQRFGILNEHHVADWLDRFQPSFIGFKKLFWLSMFQLWSEMYLDGTPSSVT